MKQKRRFILTGTPGSGKTSALTELYTAGQSIIPEAATDVIAQEHASGILKPWENADFINKIVQIQNQRQLDAKGPLQFYDRSPFCTYALATYLKFPASPGLLAEIDRCIANNIYQQRVFFFENLGFIENTEARKISYEEALVFEKMHFDAYQKFGFEIILVPKSSPQERCAFILHQTLFI